MMSEIVNIVETERFEQNIDREYFVFHNLEAPRYVAALAAWPLHVTLLGPAAFVGQNALQELRQLIYSIASEHQPFYIYPGKRAWYGPKEDREVTLVRDNHGELHAIHTKLLTGIGTLGVESFDGRWSGDQFSPHITDKEDCAPHPERFLVDSLSIALKDRGERRILETIGLA